MSVPLNKGTDPISQRVYALIFNGVTRASSSAPEEDDWIRLSERERIAEHVYAELRTGGIEVRLADGLEALRAVKPRPCCDCHGPSCESPSELCCERCTEATHTGLFPHSDGSLCVLKAQP